MDNKGPILSAACAASDLLWKCLLGCDIVFLIQGEEEVVSGFADAVLSHKVCVGDKVGLLDAHGHRTRPMFIG
jgi:di- and tripeptidase